MRIILFMLLFTPFISSASTSFDKKVDNCKSMIDSKQRLSCYDTLFDKKMEVTQNKDGIGKWKIVEKVSPIDDSKVVMLSLDANTPIKVMQYQESTPFLVIRCKENKTEFYIGFNTFLDLDTVYPTTRIDSEKAVSNQKWHVSSNHETIFYDGNTVKVTSFLKTLLKKNKYFIQVTPFGQNSVNTTFTLTGLEQAIKPLRAACGW